MYKSTLDNNFSKKIIHIETLGCRLNQIESESVASFFSSDKYIDKYTIQMQSITNAQKENSDVVLCIVNTCTVTAKAEQKARRIIRLLLKKYPSSIVIVTGCYAQVNKTEIENIDERVLVVPGRVKSRLINLPRLLEEFDSDRRDDYCEHEHLDSIGNRELQNLKNYLQTNLCNDEVPEVSEDAFTLSTDNLIKHSRASIKIQDGCNNACTYCEICIARGKSVSLDVESIIEQINKIKNNGLKEVVFTTVNIAQYFGRYKNSFVNITGLLEILLRETSDINFRFSSLYPQIVDEKFASLIKDPRVMPHFHLSVQSGSDEILQKMARPYKSQTVVNAVKLLRQARPSAFIACDIIAGFPTETDDDFEQTKKLLTECNFTFVHAFPFSPRPNTKAFLMKPKVKESVARERVNWLLDFSVKQKIAYVNSLSGSIHTAIVETSNRKGESNNYIYCVADNFLHCVIPSENFVEPKSQIKIKIIKPLLDKIANGDEYDVLADFV